MAVIYKSGINSIFGDTEGMWFIIPVSYTGPSFNYDVARNRIGILGIPDVMYKADTEKFYRLVHRMKMQTLRVYSAIKSISDIIEFYDNKNDSVKLCVENNKCYLCKTDNGYLMLKAKHDKITKINIYDPNNGIISVFSWIEYCRQSITIVPSKCAKITEQQYDSIVSIVKEMDDDINEILRKLRDDARNNRLEQLQIGTNGN